MLPFPSCRGTAWQPLAVTEAYMGLDPQVFNSEVRRRALEWRSNQEADFRAKASATLKERVQAETHAYLTRMGILDTTNPVLKNLQVRAASLLIRPSPQTPSDLRADSWAQYSDIWVRSYCAVSSSLCLHEPTHSVLFCVCITEDSAVFGHHACMEDALPSVMQT